MLAAKKFPLGGRHSLNKARVVGLYHADLGQEQNARIEVFAAEGSSERSALLVPRFRHHPRMDGVGGLRPVRDAFAQSEM